MDEFRVDLVPNCDPYSHPEERGSKKREKRNPQREDPPPDEVVLSSSETEGTDEPLTYSPPRP